MLDNNAYYGSDLGQLRKILIRRIYVVILFFLGGITLSSLFIYLNKPTYRSNFKIILSSLRFPNIENIKNDKTLNTLIRTEIGIIKGPAYLNDVYEFVRKERSKKGVDIKKLSYSKWIKNLKISRTPGTIILNVDYIDKNKEINSKVIEKVKNIMIGYSELKLEEDKLLLKKEIKFYEDKFLESIQNFQNFLTENNINLEDRFKIYNNFIKYSNIGIEPQKKVLVPILSTKNIPNILIDKKKELDSLKRKNNFDKEFKIKLEKDIKKLEQEIYKVQRLRYKSDNFVSKINNHMKVLSKHHLKLINIPVTSDPSIVISNTKVEKNENKGILLRSISAGGASGIIIGILFALIIDRRKDLVYDFEEFLSLVNYPLLKRFRNDFIPWATSIDLLKTKYAVLEEKEKIGLFKVGGYYFRSNEKFINAIEKCFGKDNYIFSNNLNDINKCKKILFILTPGCISRSNLELIQEDFNNLQSEIPGWIFVD